MTTSDRNDPPLARVAGKPAHRRSPAGHVRGRVAKDADDVADPGKRAEDAPFECRNGLVRGEPVVEQPRAPPGHEVVGFGTGAGGEQARRPDPVGRGVPTVGKTRVLERRAETRHEHDRDRLRQQFEQRIQSGEDPHRDVEEDHAAMAAIEDRPQHERLQRRPELVRVVPEREGSEIRDPERVRRNDHDVVANQDRCVERTVGEAKIKRRLGMMQPDASKQQARLGEREIRPDRKDRKPRRHRKGSGPQAQPGQGREPLS